VSSTNPVSPVASEPPIGSSVPSLDSSPQKSDQRMQEAMKKWRQFTGRSVSSVPSTPRAEIDGASGKDVSTSNQTGPFSGNLTTESILPPTVETSGAEVDNFIQWDPIPDAPLADKREHDVDIASPGTVPGVEFETGEGSNPQPPQSPSKPADVLE